MARVPHACVHDALVMMAWRVQLETACRMCILLVGAATCQLTCQRLMRVPCIVTFVSTCWNACGML